MIDVLEIFADRFLLQGGWHKAPLQNLGEKCVSRLLRKMGSRPRVAAPQIAAVPPQTAIRAIL
jgi:hypothetical protein